MMGLTLSVHVSPSHLFDHPPNRSTLHVFGSYAIAVSSRAMGGSPMAAGVFQTIDPQSMTSTWLR